MAPGTSPERWPAEERPRLEGLISERELDLAEGEFPGIVSFYRQVSGGIRPCPRTFLDLLAQFQAFRPER
ncbi:MAG: hypothetical protein KC933_24730 [Myxococcales bacterium]|nr:hypothetical protein [Myxococcales bacterium]